MEGYIDKVTEAFLQSKKDLGGATDFVHFGRAVLGKQLTPRTLKKRLLKIIDLKDYPEFTLEEMLEHFNKLTNMEIRD